MIGNVSNPDYMQISFEMELQRRASHWLYQVQKGELTRNQVAAKLDAIKDEAEREGMRKWLNHYRHIITPATPAKTPAPALWEGRKNKSSWQHKGNRK